MKVKRLPEDFRVQELTDREPSSEGPLALYELTKTDLGTPEAVDAIARSLQISRKAIAFGGLKDRHAVTAQFLTIAQGPARDVQQPNWSLRYLGRTDKHFTPVDIRGNRFRVVLRELGRGQARRLPDLARLVALDGSPNYFDDQRFGSVTADNEFIARAWLAGDYERALWLAQAAPYEFARARERQEREFLRQHWGDWALVKKTLQRSPERAVWTQLSRQPTNFRRAWGLLRADLRGLYLAALQSHLWNLILSSYLARHCPAAALGSLDLKTARVNFLAASPLPPTVSEQLREAKLPLPGAACERLPPGPIRELIETTLAGVGITLPELKVKHFRDCFFAKGQRAAMVVPVDFSARLVDDELHPGRQAAVLEFELPRGAYATMLVKRLTTAP